MSILDLIIGNCVAAHLHSASLDSSPRTLILNTFGPLADRFCPILDLFCSIPDLLGPKDCDLLLVDHAAFHYKPYAPESRNIPRRIAFHRDDVCQQTSFDRANLVRQMHHTSVH